MNDLLPPWDENILIDASRDPRERRDVQRAIDHWLRNTWGSNCVPFLDTFDFSPMKGDWGHRFLVCGGNAIEGAVFVIYGGDFARLMELPLPAIPVPPFLHQIPERYQAIFAEGYAKAFAESAPVTLKGTVSGANGIELYRAAFMPIILEPSWSKQLVFGSFNSRSVRAT